MNYIICAFYTLDTPYAEEIKNLVDSCKDLDIPLITKGYDQRGEWVQNCSIKPEFIFEMLNVYPDKNIVYVDADAMIRKIPVLFDDMQADIAVHYRDGKELLSGTIFIKNTPKMREFVQHWIDAQKSRSREWDQKVLQWCISHYYVSMKLNVFKLPPTYTQIFDTMKHLGEPVIEHFQASRRYKKAVLDQGYLSRIPKEIQGIRVRVMEDGTFVVPRMTPDIFVELSRDFNKFQNEDRWYPKSRSNLGFEECRPFFQGKCCYIVGKGPSLDLLTIEDFPNQMSPVICVNESIHKIETLALPNKLYMIQQDAWLKDSCKPLTADLFLNYTCQHWYPDNDNKVVFHFREIGLTHNCLTVIYAMSIAKMLGSIELRLLAFDASMTKDCHYAKAVGYDSKKGGNPTRFLNHRQAIVKHAKGIDLKFMYPQANQKGLEDTVSCIPVQ